MVRARSTLAVVTITTGLLTVMLTSMLTGCSRNTDLTCGGCGSPAPSAAVTAPPVVVGLRGVPLATTHCPQGLTANPANTPIPDPVIGVEYCPMDLHGFLTVGSQAIAGTPRPVSAAHLPALLTALSVADIPTGGTPGDPVNCLAVKFLATTLIAVTATHSTYLIHIPVGGCLSIQPKVSAAIKAATGRTP